MVAVMPVIRTSEWKFSSSLLLDTMPRARIPPKRVFSKSTLMGTNIASAISQFTYVWAQRHLTFAMYIDRPGEPRFAQLLKVTVAMGYCGDDSVSNFRLVVNLLFSICPTIPQRQQDQYNGPFHNKS